MSETADKRRLQKLQRAIVDGLEDVKAQDIQVFNTEGLSPLFERVIVASGNTNRQTKALAASVRDAVSQAGFDKPRSEGEENGEWIIIDCGPAVVHVMQPTIRQYYRLEDIWGGTAVRLRSGEARAKAARAAAEKANAASAARAKTGGALTPAEAARLGRASVAAENALAEQSPRPRRRVASPKRPAVAKAPVKVVKVGDPAKKNSSKRGAARHA